MEYTNRVLCYAWCQPSQKEVYRQLFRTYQKITQLQCPIVLESELVGFFKSRLSVLLARYAFLKVITFSKETLFERSQRSLGFLQDVQKGFYPFEVCFLKENLVLSSQMDEKASFQWNLQTIVPSASLSVVPQQAEETPLKRGEAELKRLKSLIQEWEHSLQKPLLKGSVGENPVVSNGAIRRTRRGRKAQKSKLDPHKKWILDSLKAGKSKTAMAKELGCTREQLYRWLAWQGLHQRVS